jgi:diguanylate cyclase (GGDEF)-like protein
MTAHGGSTGSWGWRQILLAMVFPLMLAAVILMADAFEGPKTAYVGVLTVVPMLAAVFGSPLQTAIVGVLAWSAGFAFGLVAVDGQAPAQTVRLFIIAVITIIAVFAARVRQARDHALVVATRDAAVANDLRAIAQTDELTGLLNRRGALERLPDSRVSPWSIAIVDCDSLKQVNDEKGHRAGDEYLEAISARFASSVSSADVLARWGGDEFLFAIALPLADASRVLERARSAISRDVVTTTGGPIDASVSIGACEWLPGQDLDAALQRADAALYRAKHEGGNRIVTV